MRVLICIEALGIGGKERQAVELIKGLTCRPDFECRVICLESNDFYLDELTSIGIPVEFVIRRARWESMSHARISQSPIETGGP